MPALSGWQFEVSALLSRRAPSIVLPPNRSHESPEGLCTEPALHLGMLTPWKRSNTI